MTKSNSDGLQKEKISEALKALPAEELLAVLQNLFSSKRPNPEEHRYNQNLYFLGTASRLVESDEDEQNKWGPWEIAAVAYLDRDHYPEGSGPDWGFCQAGACSSCSMRVRSNVKNGICPICHTKVYMT